MQDMLPHNKDGLVQDCSISNVLAMGIRQSCTKLSVCLYCKFCLHKNQIKHLTHGIIWHIKDIQSSAVITRSNITWCSINHYSDWGRISITVWTHKTHPIPHPNGQAIGCILLGLGKKLTVLYKQHHDVFVSLILYHIPLLLYTYMKERVCKYTLVSMVKGLPF